MIEQAEGNVRLAGNLEPEEHTREVGTLNLCGTGCRRGGSGKKQNNQVHSAAHTKIESAAIQ